MGETPLAGNQAALDSLKSADLVIDLMFLLFSKEQLEIQEAGARMLLCVEPVDNLSRLFPTEDQRRRVEASEELLGNAKSLRITNHVGTDVVYQLGSFPVMTEYGYTDAPGRWDHWPAGFLFTGGSDDGVDGKVVIDRGDIIITPFKKFVEEPVEVTIAAGRIEDIRGGFDAELLRDYIAGFDDEKAYGISHIGWGCNEKARWSGLANDRRSIGMEAGPSTATRCSRPAPTTSSAARTTRLPHRHPDAQLQHVPRRRAGPHRRRVRGRGPEGHPQHVRLPVRGARVSRLMKNRNHRTPHGRGGEA